MDIGIIGGSGYTGGELLRLPRWSSRGKCCRSYFEKQEGTESKRYAYSSSENYDLEFEDLSMEDVASRSDIVFHCVPHGTAMQVVPALLKAGVKVIDLSADTG